MQKERIKMKNFLTFFIIFTFFTNLKADILPNFLKIMRQKEFLFFMMAKAFLQTIKKERKNAFFQLQPLKFLTLFLL